jgi:hypothetical protein
MERENKTIEWEINEIKERKGVAERKKESKGQKTKMLTNKRIYSYNSLVWQQIKIDLKVI